MSVFVNTVDIIGDKALTDSIIDRSITEIADNHINDIGKYAFQKCSLTKANFLTATSIGVQAFSTCSKLTAADFHAANTMGMYAFISCDKLITLILRSATMCTLANKNALQNTPISKGTGYIYVPRALLSDDDATKDYRRATNWSTYAAQFRALEDYTVDGTITGELDSTKI